MGYEQAFPSWCPAQRRVHQQILQRQSPSRASWTCFQLPEQPAEYRCPLAERPGLADLEEPVPELLLEAFYDHDINVLVKRPSERCRRPVLGKRISWTQALLLKYNYVFRPLRHSIPSARRWSCRGRLITHPCLFCKGFLTFVYGMAKIYHVGIKPRLPPCTSGELTDPSGCLRLPAGRRGKNVAK